MRTYNRTMSDHASIFPAAQKKPPRTCDWLAFICLILVIIGALFFGRVTVGVADFWAWWQDAAAIDSPMNIVFSVRAPRVLAAAFIGAGLSIAGLASQIALRNPLASPDVLGVSAGAGLGACIAMAAGASVAGISLAAFAAGVFVTAVVMAVSAALQRVSGRDPVLMTVLVGLAISSFCAAGISAVKWWADPFSKLPAITFWLLGSLATLGWIELAWLVLGSGLALALLLAVGPRLGVLALGDAVARSAGANVAALRWVALTASALLSAITVAFCGMIGWLALLMPHAARAVRPADARGEPWALCALLGAIALVVIDTLCRSIADSEFPPGVALGALGAPAFLWALTRVLPK